MDAQGPNAEQITYWNEQSGPKWVANQARLDRMIAPFGEAAMQALGVGRGAHVIDVGCGCGDTTLALARHVGPEGFVLGIDISTVMLAHARARAGNATNVRFVAADAQTHGFSLAEHDALFSRFGVMFFADPTAAFRNLRTALRPGAHLAFACWQPVTENPWVLVPLGAAAQHISLAPPPPPGTPGPFALSDRERVRGILEAAGFSQIACDPIGPAIEIGEHLDAATEFVVQVGPTGSALREAGPDAVPAVMGAIRRALEPFLTPRGVIMPSAAWVVSGRA